jgi:microcystin-dependent protein
MSFVFAPKGWAQCNGQLMPINQNQALFSLLGTTYGGDGMRTFGLPGLQGRTPISFGSGHSLGEVNGTPAVTLNIGELPTHTHSITASSQNANAPAPQNALFAQAANTYTGAAATTAMVPATVSNTGGSQAHNNMQPYLTLNLCIALQGVFPTQN